jgi:hypothetical protein
MRKRRKRRRFPLALMVTGEMAVMDEGGLVETVAREEQEILMKMQVMVEQEEMVEQLVETVVREVWQEEMKRYLVTVELVEMV